MVHPQHPKMEEVASNMQYHPGSRLEKLLTVIISRNISYYFHEKHQKLPLLKTKPKKHQTF